MQEFRKYETFNILPVWLENAYSLTQNWCFWWISPPKWGAVSTKPPKGTSAGLNGSSGVLIISLSVIVSEKSRGNKKCDKEEEEEEGHIFWPFWHHCKMAATWLYATLLISICSFCRGQHTDANI